MIWLLLACRHPVEPDFPQGSPFHLLDGPGVWRVGDASEVLPPLARVRTMTLLGTEENVEYPDVLPHDWPLIDRQWLVIVGEGELVPVIPSDVRHFGSMASPREVGPWSYLGVVFDDDTHLRKVDAPPPLQFDDVEGLTARAFWPPAGDYGVRTADRLVLVRVATLGAAPTQEQSGEGRQP